MSIYHLWITGALWISEAIVRLIDFLKKRIYDYCAIWKSFQLLFTVYGRKYVIKNKIFVCVYARHWIKEPICKKIISIYFISNILPLKLKLILNYFLRYLQNQLAEIIRKLGSKDVAPLSIEREHYQNNIVLMTKNSLDK